MPLACLLLATACPMSSPDPAPTPEPAVVQDPVPGALAGTVHETMDAAGYTYIHIQTPQGLMWAAVRQTPLTVGEQVQIVNVSWMQGFHSPSMGRTFDQIAFGSLANGAQPNPHVTSATPSPEAHAATPIAKADDGHTVEEVFANKGSLVGQQVTIRGRVVKFTPGVMNTNWMHLQDGSGSADARNNDITVTTLGTAAVGDVVVVTGTVATDKDLGANYHYDVLVENATISR